MKFKNHWSEPAVVRVLVTMNHMTVAKIETPARRVHVIGDHLVVRYQSTNCLPPGKLSFNVDVVVLKRSTLLEMWSLNGVTISDSGVFGGGMVYVSFLSNNVSSIKSDYIQ